MYATGKIRLSSVIPPTKPTKSKTRKPGPRCHYAADAGLMGYRCDGAAVMDYDRSVGRCVSKVPACAACAHRLNRAAALDLRELQARLERNAVALLTVESAEVAHVAA